MVVSDWTVKKLWLWLINPGLIGGWTLEQNIGAAETSQITEKGAERVRTGE